MSSKTEHDSGYVHSLASVDFLQLMYSLYTFGVLLGLPLLWWPHRVPQFSAKVYCYGLLSDGLVSSSSSNTNKLMQWLLLAIRVPKSKFSHFYVTAICFHAIVSGMIFWSYFTGRSVPYVVTMLDIVTTVDRKADVKPVAVLVVTTLFMCQLVRRCYECFFVSVYSNSQINLVHYVLGITYYLAASCSLIAQAPGFTRGGFNRDDFAHFGWEWHELLGCAMYFWATWHEHKCTVILANLRKQSGRVTTKRHKIPFGDWFDYVSNPHYFAELLIYFALNIVLSFRNTVWISALLFTVVNQTILALLKHRWYHDTFKEYPKNRKAIFPFLL